MVTEMVSRTQPWSARMAREFEGLSYGETRPDRGAKSMITVRRRWPKAAAAAEAAGAFLIDINMAARCARSPAKAAQVACCAIRSWPADRGGGERGGADSVTVKTRLGWCGSSADPLGFCLAWKTLVPRPLTLQTAAPGSRA